MVTAAIVIAALVALLLIAVKLIEIRDDRQWARDEVSAAKWRAEMQADYRRRDAAEAARKLALKAGR